MKEDNIKYLGIMFGKICSDIAVKCVATGALIIAEFFIDGILAKAIAGLFFLIIFDWITGIFAARKTGQIIKSSKIVRTPIKIAVYFMLIVCARIAEYSLPHTIGYLDELVIAFLTLTELISVIENTGKMGYAIPMKLLKKLQNLRDDEFLVADKV